MKRLLIVFLFTFFISYSLLAKSTAITFKIDGVKLQLLPSDLGPSQSWYNARAICSRLNAEGYNDWVLPSLEELKLIHAKIQRTKLSKTFNYKSYWSATEKFNTHVYCPPFYPGKDDNLFKIGGERTNYCSKKNVSDEIYVLCIRAL